VGKVTFDAAGQLKIASSKDVNAPVYSHADGVVKLTMEVATGAKLWAQIGDGLDLKPGFSYAFGPVTAQLEIPFVKTLFTQPVIRLEPKVSYSANGIGASLKGVFALADVNKNDGTDNDGWPTYKQADTTSFAQGLELAGNFTTGPIKVEATFFIPLYKNWTLDPAKLADTGILSSDAFNPMDGFNGKGITIAPKITYTASALSLYATIKIGNIGIHSDLIDLIKAQPGAKKLGASIVPTIGATYAF
jgi:hypothetical protein